jgi:hypothetical protein
MATAVRRVLVAVALIALATAGGCAPTEPSGGVTSRTTMPTAWPTTPPTSVPATPPSTSSRSATPPPTTTAPTQRPTEAKSPAPALRIALRPGDSGPKVRALQARLRQIGWFSGDVTDYYGSRTTEALRGFQAKRGFPVTGIADERTYDRLLSMTRPPTSDELNNIGPTPAQPGVSSWDVDRRCLTGRVICISKSTRSLTWVIDGAPQYAMDVRFGSEEEPTREGVFAITYKKGRRRVDDLPHGHAVLDVLQRWPGDPLLGGLRPQRL